ncbi:hypothetical protein ACWFQ8_30340 [Streptomyces sp. NPDC055254]
MTRPPVASPVGGVGGYNPGRDQEPVGPRPASARPLRPAPPRHRRAGQRRQPGAHLGLQGLSRTASGSLIEGIDRIPAATESRDGYVRTAFKHWNAGDLPEDGCNTRAEVLLEEAVDYPEIAPGCKLTGGRWFSPYDGIWVTSASGLDVDHLVPLAESWDSK